MSGTMKSWLNRIFYPEKRSRGWDIAMYSVCGGYTVIFLIIMAYYGAWDWRLFVPPAFLVGINIAINISSWSCKVTRDENSIS